MRMLFCRRAVYCKINKIKVKEFRDFPGILFLLFRNEVSYKTKLLRSIFFHIVGKISQMKEMRKRIERMKKTIWISGILVLMGVLVLLVLVTWFQKKEDHVPDGVLVKEKAETRICRDGWIPLPYL